MLPFSLLDDTSGSGIGNFETFFVLPMEAIILQSLHDDGRLDLIFEINETVKVFPPHFRHLRNETSTEEPWKRPKNMRHLAFSGVAGNSVHVQTTGRVFGDLKKFQLQNLVRLSLLKRLF